jgi:hypothetical protein
MQFCNVCSQTLDTRSPTDVTSAPAQEPAPPDLTPPPPRVLIPPLAPEPPQAATRPESAPAPSRSSQEEADRQHYDGLVSGVRRRLDEGFDLFGFVGHAASGKTHCLKALNYRLERHGVGAGKANRKFQEAAVPGQTEASVFDFTYTGPNQERWIFFDAGGELYANLQENDWTRNRQASLALAHLLYKCKGLFMFLHLDRSHFNYQLIDRDERIYGEDTDTQRKKASEMRSQLDFFKHFILFLRAIKHEKGDVEAVIDHCSSVRGSLEEALLEYDRQADLLDIPVMFFFTQADKYSEADFEISSGVHLTPRTLPMATAVFTARFLHPVFSGLFSQVRRFKFDFLQSYAEHRSGSDFGGNPLSETGWHGPDNTPLSVGLMSGLEFVLRNQAGAWWQTPGLDTRRALILHRLLNREQWRDVDVDLGSWLRPAGGKR